MLKLPCTIRLDPSDTFVFERAADPGRLRRMIAEGSRKGDRKREPSPSMRSRVQRDLPNKLIFSV